MTARLSSAISADADLHNALRRDDSLRCSKAILSEVTSLLDEVTALLEDQGAHHDF
jgi:hypothetical protein